MAALLALSLMVVSCGGGSENGGKEEPLVPPSVSIKTQSVSGEAGSQFLTVTATGNWTISTNATWLTVSPSSGSGSSSTVVLSYTENTDAIRTAAVTISSSGGSAVANITQSKLVVPVPPAMILLKMGTVMVSRQLSTNGSNCRKPLRMIGLSSSPTI